MRRRAIWRALIDCIHVRLYDMGMKHRQKPQWAHILIVILFMFVIMLWLLPHAEKTSASSGRNTLSHVRTVNIARICSVLSDYVAEQGVSLQVTYQLYDLTDGSVCQYREDTEMVAASVYKLPLAMLYYDMMASGTISSSDLIYYPEDAYEAGGPIADSAVVGSEIELASLLEAMIVSSDNTAAHILFINLGGYRAFREQAMKYTNLSETLLVRDDNVLTAAYMSDVLVYLYDHQTRYLELFEDLREAEPTTYLNHVNHLSTAQKYGDYQAAQNASGIVEEGYPYAISIFTTLGTQGPDFIGQFNAEVMSLLN